MGLTRIAITRPVFILMLMAAAILMGWIGYNSMRVELNPDVSFGVVTVTTVYPGAGSDEINTLITKPLEDAVTGIANVREVTASSQEGVSSVIVNFEIGSNMDVALNEVRTRVDTASGRLPREAEKPIVGKFDTSSSPVITLALRSQALSNRQLRDLAENAIKDRFARIKGVANVSVSGGDLRELQVRLKRDALVRYGVGVVDVQRAIVNSSVNIPAGKFQSGEKEYTVRVYGEIKSVDQLENLYLTISDPNRNGPSKQIRLGDIATIADSNTERRSYSRLNGDDSVVIVIQKAANGNAVEISNSLLGGGEASLINQLSNQYNVKFEVTTDAAVEIKESLADLNLALILGILLVGAVIWLFLHNFRGTLIVGIAIPVCLFATLVALWVFGFTINNLSMLALSLAVGVLVDDSIVVIENIYRHLKMGEEPVEAAINGRAEIGLAAIAITMADVVVFLPIGFMGGIVGQFFRPLGIGYAVAVMISLFVSFTVTPMLAARWYRKGEDWEHPKGRFASWFEHTFESFANSYRKVLRFSLSHKWYFFGGGFAVLVALFMFIGGSFAPDTAGAIKTGMSMLMPVAVIAALIFLGNLIFYRRAHFGVFLGAAGFLALFIAAPVFGNMYAKWKQESVFKFAFVPPSDGGEVKVDIELPPGSNLDQTLKVVKYVEDKVKQHPMTKYVVTNVGTQESGFSASSSGTQYAQTVVTLLEKEAIMDKLSFKKHEEKQRPMSVSSEDVAAQMLQSIGRVPGAKVNVSASSGFGFGAAIQLAFKSDDREKLVATAKKVRDGLAEGVIKGVITPDITSKPGKPEVRAVPDRARMAEANVTTAELGSAMRTLYEGDDTAKFRVAGKEYDIRVMLDLADRNNPELVSTIPVTFREGTPIYLTEVAKLESAIGVDKIDRRDKEEVVTVNAELLPGFAAGTVQGEIDEWLKKEKLIPEGVSYRPLGQADAQSREMVYLFSAMGIGLVLVYMILAALFNNLLYPLIIQLAQPQAMIGAILALVLTDKTLNIVGFIGIIALIGLVGKNAILLVDYTNTLRERGEDRIQALVDAGGTRIRPIMMTTIALILGMLPVALAIGRGSEFRETIGITIIGGTILSTFLTLLVIPCSYLIFDDLSSRFQKRKSSQTAEPTVQEETQIQ